MNTNIKQLLISSLLFTGFLARGQDSTLVNHPKLVLDIMAVDLPFLSNAVQARANYRSQTIAEQPAKVKFRDAIAVLESPSMNQAIEITTSFYNTMNFGIAKLWYKKDRQSMSLSAKVFRDIGTEFTAAVAFIATTKVPFAAGWAHEEFHRSTWIPYEIGSFNEIWSFNLLPDALTSVSHLKDDDLAMFKTKDPAGFVRMQSSGIEAHYLLNESVQTQDFRLNTNLPTLAMYWADVAAAADYVGRAHTIKTIEEHNDVYNDEPDQLKRDFTGNDFTAWVYDLFRADEAYSDRGVHPTGIGIDRYRDFNDLSMDMLSYVEKMGNRQWLNIISPFMLRIRRLKVSDNFAFNFAVRHFLTSFGDDTQYELFLNYGDRFSQITFHRYSNYDDAFTGIEFKSFAEKLKIGTKKFEIDGRLMLWNQPKNQDFFSSDGTFGILTAIRGYYTSQSKWQPYLEIEGKSNGWVAGNPYLTSKISGRFGIRRIFTAN
ncbi:MAG: hypothetical protein RJQ09_02325 [Cyclobacteriaceae bacterium]